MLESWEKLVLKWLHCFGVGPIVTISDVKEKDFIRALGESPTAGSKENALPFHELLAYLKNHYPHFNSALADPDHVSWSKERELYLLATLLLLHASIYHPSESFKQRAGQNLSEDEQQLIVCFLQRAIKYDQNLTIKDLSTCVASSEEALLKPQAVPLSPSPVLARKQRRSQGTPLTDFLSSPVARQRRRESGNIRVQLSSLEDDLERELIEKEALQRKISHLEAQLSELGKKYKKKMEEEEALFDSLRVAHEGQNAVAGDYHVEKRKLAESELYVQQLLSEISTLKVAHESQQLKLIKSERESENLQDVLKACKEELVNIKGQVEQYVEENSTLKQRCSQLQRDVNQMQSSAMLSPVRPVYSNTSPANSPVPENLGFILEKEMIAKENENLQLEETVKELQDELSNLKAAYNQLQEETIKNNESAARAQKRVQTSLANIQTQLDSTYKELSVCNRDKEAIVENLTDVTRERDGLASQVAELAASKSALETEQTALHDLNHTLEVKVAKLQAKITIASETEKELHDLIKKRASELSDTKQEMDDMEVKMKKAIKEKTIMEQQLNDTIKKLNVVKNVELEKSDLEDQVMALKQTCEDLEKKCDSSERTRNDLSEKLHTLLEEKKLIKSHLKDAISKKNHLSTSLDHISAEKNAVIAEKIALLKEKVQWEAKLSEAQRRLAEAKENICSEDTEKTILKDKLAELMASNERLSSELSISTQQENDMANQLAEILKQKKLTENHLSRILKEKDKLEAALHDTFSQLSKVSQDKESLSLRLAEKISECESVTSSIADLVNLKINVEAQLSEAKVEGNKLEYELSETMQNLDSVRLELCHLKEELKTLRQECDDKSAAIADLEAEKADTEDDLSHYVSTLNAATQENVTLKAELSSLRDDKEGLLLKCESMQLLNSSLEEKLHQMELSLLSFAHEKESLTSEVENFSKERHNLILQVNYLKTVVSDLQEDFESSKVANLAFEQQIASQLSEIDALQTELQIARDEFAATSRALQDDCDEKSQQLSILREDLQEVQLKKENLLQEMNKVQVAVQSLTLKNGALEAEVANHISQIEVMLQEKVELSELIAQAQLEKESAFNSVEVLKEDLKSVVTETEEKSKTLILQKEYELKSALAEKEHEIKSKLTEIELQWREKEEQLKLTAFEKEKELKAVFAEAEERFKSALSERQIDLNQAILEKDEALKSLEHLKLEISNQTDEVNSTKLKMKVEIEALQKELDRVGSDKKSLEVEIDNYTSTMKGAEEKIRSLEQQILENVTTIEELKEQLASHTDNQIKLQGLMEMKNDTVNINQENFEILEQHKELLAKAKEEKDGLLCQIDELQGAIDVKDELLSETQKCVEKLRGERESLRELLVLKDQIINCQNATASSLERQTSDELDVAMKLLEGGLHSSQSTSEMIAEELKKVRINFEEEKANLEEALKEAQLSAQNYKQEAVELKQQLKTPCSGGKLFELQHEERLWQSDRIKNQVAFQYSTMMTQKTSLEEHLCQLRDIIKDVSRICDNLFATLPPNCNAVHEVTIMRKEVETKLRVVDKKYADSLCGIISLADEMFQWMKRKSNLSEVEESSEHKNLDLKVSKSCEAMTSLSTDVRSAINSCKFLIERCESYLKAQTRESLKIKTSISKEDAIIEENSTLSNQSEGSSSSSSTPKTAVDLTNKKEVCVESHPAWFGGSETPEGGYELLKNSHAELEKQVSDFKTLSKQLSSSPQSCDAQEVEIATLQDKINLLMLRPTQEHLEEKLKELHAQYSSKLECMKAKMKQIVTEEVEKVQEERASSEKEITQKLNKRIAEFEEHVQELSAQLWNLGEKLLKEQQDHKSTRDRFEALKERQRQYVMSKQRTQSLDRLDMLLQGANSIGSSTQMKRRCNSQTTQSGLASSKVHPMSDISTDVVDESMSRRSTMMAPASMGLAFPEEDEDGEMFNNDYLAELKEGRCRVPLDGSRLSELQYRNSLCPPHLKSSYPLETQFHDGKTIKDEDIKGPIQVADARHKKQGKDRGTTSYQKPGPPTPSKKGGRLSLQGKEDLTPRVAALREHNESQSSGVGMLRAGKTTPSRLRALFTSSKVANAAALSSSKKDDSTTPATPTSKRLSIFKRRFGSNKENQNSNYSSFR